MSHRLPVTLIGGFLGAGKTSLLHHIISEHQGGHLAVLVENPGPLNLDAKAIRGLCGAMRRSNDAVFEIPNGDEAAQVAAIAMTLRELAQSGRYERVLMELSGTSNPAWLARQAEAFSEWAEVEQVICVVDALDLYRASRNVRTDPAYYEFKLEQAAGSSLIILNKCDLIDDKERQACTKLLRGLGPQTQIIETDYGEVPAEIWSKIATSQEPATALVANPPRPANDSEEPELSTALYRTHRPFHPQRFWEWFEGDHPGLLRVKGLIWLATRNLLVGGVSRTRWQNSCGAAGIWWAALPREEWPPEPETLMRMQETWREPYGDRRQELVLIGETQILSTTMRRELDGCLLTDAEFARPVREWSSFPDPFPAWDLEEG